MIKLKAQVMASVLFSLQRAAADTTLVPQAEQIRIKNITKNRIQISVKMPHKPWEKFTLYFAMTG